MRIKKSKVGLARSRGGDALLFIIVALFGAFMLVPFVYAIVQSLKPTEEIFVYPPQFFVKNPTTENYRSLFQLTGSLWIPFERNVLNSVLVTVTGTVANLLFSSMVVSGKVSVSRP